MERDPELEKKMGEYFKAVKPADLGTQFQGYNFSGDGSTYEDMLEVVHRVTMPMYQLSQTDIDENLADPGLYGEMVEAILHYLEMRGIQLD